jgi:predicted ribosomally synthesized peptide with nif11-like leader
VTDREEIARFFRDLDEDDDLRARYWESVETATMAATVELAKAAGYDCTADDIRSEFETQAGTLSENELDAIAGGAEPLLGGSERPDPRSRFIRQLMRFHHAKY